MIGRLNHVGVAVPSIEAAKQTYIENIFFKEVELSHSVEHTSCYRWARGEFSRDGTLSGKGFRIGGVVNVPDAVVVTHGRRETRAGAHRVCPGGDLRGPALTLPYSSGS